MTARMHVRVGGGVQMVGFRLFTVETARRSGLCGWVRNSPDGAVELVAEGERAALEELLAAVRRGPRAAQVHQVSVRWDEPTGEFAGFSVRV